MSNVKTKRVKIEVTAEHIAQGVKGNDCLCPVAKAIRAVVKPKTYVSVGGTGYALVMNRTHWNSHYLGIPKKADKFIHDFDAKGRKAVKPFSFMAAIPVDLLRGEK